MKKYYLIALGLVILILTFFPYKKEKIEVVKEEPLVEVKEVVKEEIKYVNVDVKGEVNKPGVYKLESTKRVIDAIKMASGFTKNADSNFINLSKLLTDEMIIRVYSKVEVKEKVIIEYIEKECECETITNDACIKEELISINTSTILELQNIPGIGATKAKAIFDYRTTNGLFKTLEEIKNVPGIGDTTYENIKDYITL